MPSPPKPSGSGFGTLGAFQAAFAARLRDPASQPRPAGVPARRMRAYEELVYNNIESFLLACYPITRAIVGARAWKRSVKAFLAGHRAHSPLFRDIPRAFLDWLSPRLDAFFPDRPWLAEFMEYEWLELAVLTNPEEPDWTGIDAGGDLLAGCPVLHPGARLACFAYPVHRIGPRKPPPPTDGSGYCFLIFRTGDDQSRFIELTPMSARLLDTIRQERCTGRQALAGLAAGLGQSDPVTLEPGARDVLEGLRDAGAILGTGRKATP